MSGFLSCQKLALNRNIVCLTTRLTLISFRLSGDSSDHHAGDVCVCVRACVRIFPLKLPDNLTIFAKLRRSLNLLPVIKAFKAEFKLFFRNCMGVKLGR